jgi:hypothetical protein
MLAVGSDFPPQRIGLGSQSRRGKDSEDGLGKEAVEEPSKTVPDLESHICTGIMRLSYGQIAP